MVRAANQATPTMARAGQYALGALRSCEEKSGRGSRDRLRVDEIASSADLDALARRSQRRSSTQTKK